AAGRRPGPGAQDRDRRRRPARRHRRDGGAVGITVPPAARGRLSLEADFDVEAVRADFPILCRQIGDRPLVYLDSAATSQKPVQVLDAVERYYRESNSNVHRGAHTLGNEATELFENAPRPAAASKHPGARRRVLPAAPTDP